MKKIVSVWGEPWIYTDKFGTHGPASYKDFQTYATEEQKEFWKDWRFQF